MIPVLLHISGFLSYRQPVDIDFRSLDLACISGANGAGKSTIFDAMTWALFGNARKTDDSLIHTHPDVRAAEVRFIFWYENNLYRIQRLRPRNKTTILEFAIAQTETGENGSNDDLEKLRWKPLTERSLRETQERIKEILRVDYDTFVNASFFLQGKADQFTTQNPTNRKRILSSILGLEIWEEYKKRAIERRRKVEADINRLEGQLKEISDELEEEEKRRAALAEAQKELRLKQVQREEKERLVASYRAQVTALEKQKEQVETLSQQVENDRQYLHQLSQRLADRQAEKDKYDLLLQRAPEVEANHARYLQARQELDELEKQFQAYADIDKQRQALMSQLQAEEARLNQELSQLMQEERGIQESDEHINHKQLALKQVEVELTRVDEELQKRNEIQQAIEAIQMETQERAAANKQLYAEMNELRERIDKLEADPDAATCPLCGQPLAAPEREELVKSLTEQGLAKKNQYQENKERIKALEADLDSWKSLQKNLPLLENRARQLTAQAQNLKTSLETLQKNKEQWQETRYPRLEQVRLLLAEESYLPEVRRQIQSLEDQIRQLGYDLDKHNVIRKLENDLRPFVDEIQNLREARANLAQVERQITDLHQQIAEFQRQSDSRQAEWQKARQAYEEAKNQAPDLSLAERELSILREEEGQLNMKVGAAKQKVDVLTKLKADLQMVQKERDHKNNLVSLYKQLEHAFGKDGIPALLIEQALPQIEERANETLARLSNGDMSLRFITQAEYKDRNRADLKETLEIQISDSQGIRDYELYSGGEAFRINFAIRLAIAEVLAHRAGARLQTLVIDEGFGSQDAQGRQRLIEAINLVRHQFAKILVITHLDELKEAFPTRIEVEKTVEGSRVTIL